MLSQCQWCFKEFEDPIPRKYCLDTDCKVLAYRKKIQDQALPGETLLECLRCKWIWIRRPTGPPPKVCPHCHNPNWGREKAVTTYTCKRCGRSWEGRKDPPPLACRHCSSYRWNKDRVRMLSSQIEIEARKLAEKMVKEMLGGKVLEKPQPVTQSEQPLAQDPVSPTLDEVVKTHEEELAVSLNLLEEAFSKDVKRDS